MAVRANMSGLVGRRMMRPLTARQRFRGPFAKAPVNLGPFAPNRSKVEVLSMRAGDHDQIHSRRKQIGPQTKALAAQALDPIAPHGVPHSPSNDEANSGSIEFGWSPRLGSHEQCKMSRSDAAPEALRPDEFGVVAEPPVPPEGKRHSPRRRLLLVDGRHQVLPALATAIRQDFATTAGGHASAKAVRARTPDIVGLISALHDRPLGAEREHRYGRGSSATIFAMGWHGFLPHQAPAVFY